MAIARCGNCGHVGRPVRSIAGSTGLVMAVLFVASLFFPLLWFVFVIAFLMAIFEPKSSSCRKCGAPYPVPMDRAEVAAWKESTRLR